MDETTVGEPWEIPDGFPGERMHVLPRPVVETALAGGPTAQILVTDAGVFPRARRHGRTRDAAQETILIQCTAGHGECTLDGTTHRIGPGQVLLIPPGVPHHYAADPEDPWTIWWVHVTGQAVEGLLTAMGHTLARPVRDLVEPGRVTTLIDTVLRRMSADETHASLLAAGGAAWHLLAVLAADGRVPTRGRRDPVREVRALLRQTLDERVSIDEIATLTGYSASHISALFRESTGFGIIEYHTRLRMARARELLDTSDLSIARIAAQVGYPDPLYFSRQFRRIHDQSPSQYRGRVDR